MAQERNDNGNRQQGGQNQAGSQDSQRQQDQRQQSQTGREGGQQGEADVENVQFESDMDNDDAGRGNAGGSGGNIGR